MVLITQGLYYNISHNSWFVREVLYDGSEEQSIEQKSSSYEAFFFPLFL